MADKDVVFVQVSDAQAAKQLAEDMKKLKANPLNVTRPGGYFIGADGKAHDAWGKPVKGEGEPEDPAEVEAELAETERKIADLRQRAAVARSQANTKIDADAREHERKLAAGEADDEENEEASSSKKKTPKRK